MLNLARDLFGCNIVYKMPIWHSQSLKNNFMDKDNGIVKNTFCMIIIS